jgi:hypothetical protein
MKRNVILSLFLILSLGALCFAQDDFTAERNTGWKNFSRKNYDKFDFAKTKITSAQLKKLKTDGAVNELALLRGVVFGKRGRIFKEKDIQEYLEKQAWYKPKADFTNAILTKTERDNLDLIRLAEAERHDTVQPGDLRLWQTREIPDDKIYTETAATWRILIAEIEAIHGRRFDEEPWLQNYFEERYWYKANPNYDSSILSAIERKNLEKLNAKRDEDRKVAVSLGDMDKFQNAPLTEELLKGLALNDLRLIRNEFWARRGRKFVTPGFKQYFEWRDWYKPLKDQTKVKLNPIEEANVKLIEAVETRQRERIALEPITPEMVEGLFVEDLKVLRNEIYARRGRVFKDAKLQSYFIQQAWYQPNPDFKDEQLSETEAKNLAIIREAEQNAISKFSEVEG